MTSYSLDDTLHSDCGHFSLCVVNLTVLCVIYELWEVYEHGDMW